MCQVQSLSGFLRPRYKLLNVKARTLCSGARETHHYLERLRHHTVFLTADVKIVRLSHLHSTTFTNVSSDEVTPLILPHLPPNALNRKH